MKAAAFTLQNPADLQAAGAALAAGARPLAGGQSLGPMLNFRVAQPPALLRLAALPELGGVAATPSHIFIGAAVTHAQIADGLAPDVGGNILPAIAEGIAYRAVRNRGTIGGSLCHADPAADWLCTLVALGADAITFRANAASRAVPLRDFVAGAFRTVLQPGEILRAVRIPRRSATSCWGYTKACRKTGEFAHAMAAVLQDEPAGLTRIVVGAMGGPPLVFEGAGRGGRPHRRQFQRRGGGAGRTGPAHAARHHQTGPGDGTRMNGIALTVNGKPVRAEVAPRTHLADFLREQLHLTATHLGCEHGVCGACTLLLDGAPARACITFAATCDGRDIRSLEGLDDDSVTAALRDAFKAEHALQCGFCTPGMLVTARDIVLRLPEADDDRVRVELAGNLCRCTGYNGIVKAIRRVLDLRLNATRPTPAALPIMAVPKFVTVTAKAATPRTAAAKLGGDGNAITQALRLALPRDALWAALQDPALVASCVPGARLTSAEAGHIAGEMVVSLGPIQGKFTGTADLTYDQPAYAGNVWGEGKDQATGTRLSGGATFRVTAETEAESILHLVITYTLRGALAQFARGPVVKAFADEIAGMVGRNLQARLRGEAAQTAMRQMSAAGLMGRVIWRWCRRLLSRNG